MKKKSSIFRIEKKHMAFHLMLLVPVILVLIYCYLPMAGIIIAFMNYKPALGFAKSEFVGWDNFVTLFNNPQFGIALRNTIIVAFWKIVTGLFVPIIFSLLLNEVRNKVFKRTIQTITYLPHFVSTVVAVGLVCNLLSYNGLLNQITALFGAKPQLWLSTPKYFPWIHELSSLWQNMGYNSIIFLAALSSIDSQLLDAAAIDGCNRFQRVWHVHIPGILPTILLLLLMRVGSMMSIGYERIILLYNEATYETADVMSTFVYRKGLMGGQMSYGSAVDLFNSMINLTLLFIFNGISRRVSEISLW